MTFLETIRLAHGNFSVSRKRSVATVVTVGILFGVLLTLVLALQGLENVVMRYCVADMEKSGISTSVREAEVVEVAPLDKVRRYFDDKKRELSPVVVVIFAVAAIILTFTMAQVISQSAGSFVIYRIVGASRFQIFAIYLVYLLEICLAAAIFAALISFVLAGVITVFSWDYLVTQLGTAYPMAPSFAPVLIGMNWRYWQIMAGMFLIAPVAFLLCIDQFSAKKLAFRLKGE